MTDDTRQAVTVGLVQMTSGRDVASNTAAATDLIRAAASRGATYVQTPEVTNIMELERDRLLAACEPEETNSALAAFCDLARACHVHLHIGSMAVKAAAGSDRLLNRSYVIAPDGTIIGRYDKIHMFNVTLADGEAYAESANYDAGPSAVTVDLPWGRLGLTICYDVRFPYLHRALAKAGAIALASPAAFTHTTGKAHWHTLLQARAIETQTFVLAAGQTGRHEHGRRTYGHSLVISPWGEIIAEADDQPGTVIAELDLSLVAKARARLLTTARKRSKGSIRARSNTKRRTECRRILPIARPLAKRTSFHHSAKSLAR
ncbi:MAG: carbon-nitrogen hydrolase family protein [Pseudomonadota bacterium]